MNDRDRLIELLANSGCSADLDTYQELADHLLANGVIVPPCKVGDVLFYIDRYSGEVEEDEVKFFTVTKNGIKPILTRHNIKFWEMYKWGKTVFLTKEEAEQALKEREQNG